jgi:uncharacterized SAM-binding protein YcdF (DUF218 family)
VLAGIACMALPVESWALRPLEDRFPRVTDPPAKVTGIIVLGGVIDAETSSDHGEPVLNDAGNRLTTFVILSRRYPDARLVFTGGTPERLPGGVTEASFARDLLTSLGVPPDRVTYEDKSLTTVENAVFTREMVHPAPGETWVLVTSASHMPRSVGVFRQAGWSVLPWPTGYHSRNGLFPWSYTFGNKLELLDLAAHEWTGLLVYWATGKTNALFPR